MSDPQDSLHEILAELQAALEASVDLAEDTREELRSTAAEIRKRLDEERTGDDEEGSLGARLNAALESFEHSHPRLTAAVGRVADALSDLGI